MTPIHAAPGPGVTIVTFAGGIMAAEYADVHPDAYSAARRAFETDGAVRLPSGGVRGRIDIDAPLSGWLAITDHRGMTSLALLYRGPEDDEAVSELLAMAAVDAGGLAYSPEAWDRARREMAPFALVVIGAGSFDHRASELAQLSAWLVYAWRGVAPREAA